MEILSEVSLSHLIEYGRDATECIDGLRLTKDAMLSLRNTRQEIGGV